MGTQIRREDQYHPKQGTGLPETELHHRGKRYGGTEKQSWTLTPFFAGHLELGLGFHSSIRDTRDLHSLW